MSRSYKFDYANSYSEDYLYSSERDYAVEKGLINDVVVIR